MIVVYFTIQEQTHEKEQNMIQDLERMVEEKDRELIAVKRDNEVKQRQIIELQEQVGMLLGHCCLLGVSCENN